MQSTTRDRDASVNEEYRSEYFSERAVNNFETAPNG